MSSRANIPARRPVSTIRPATAFCNSLRQATVVKSAARSTAQRVPASACCTRSAPGRSGSVRRGVARTRQRHRHRAAPGTRPPTAAPYAAGQGGKLLALLNAVLQHAHHGVRGTQGRQPGAMASVWRWFSPRQRPGSKGRLSPSGRCAPGRAPLISPSSVRSTSAEWAVRPQAIGALPL